MMTTSEALQRLREGNRRFAESRPEYPSLDQQRREMLAKEGQKPFACVLSCSDSRVPSEHIFDCGFGDLFMIRVAGNVCHSLEQGSVEFAVWELGVPLVVVLGHTDCGAVTAAVKGITTFGSIRMVLDRVLPSVYQARAELPRAGEDEILFSAITRNVFKSMEDLLLGSLVVRKSVCQPARSPRRDV